MGRGPGSAGPVGRGQLTIHEHGPLDRLPDRPVRADRPQAASTLGAIFIALVVPLFAVLFPATPARADLGGFVIRDFDAAIEVQQNGDIDVTEALTIHFSEPRHGIYRTIPYSYTDPRGYRYTFGMRLEGVTDERGQSYGTQVSRSGGSYQIRIGDPESTVMGEVVYRIRYRVERALVRFAEHDEIYWNVTGNEWATSIAAARATLRLPAPLPVDSLEAAGYTGRFGATDREVEITYPEPGVVTFAATRPLGPLEGLTVALAWPDGYVRHPGKVARALRLLRDNGILLAPLLWLAFLYRRYRREGRDPAGQGTLVVRYEPPEGLSPAEIGTIIDERVDLRDITATVVDLAVRGFLRIREEERTTAFGLLRTTDTWFTKVAGAELGTLLPHERKIYDGIFAYGEEVNARELREKFYVKLEGIRNDVIARLVARGSFDRSPRSVRNRWVGLGFLAAVVTFLGGLGLALAAGGIFPNALFFPILAAVASALLFFAFSRAMPRRTARGVSEREWALGFQEFVQRAEADRLERDLAEDNPRAVFERLLPYAMVLGVASTWARRFRDLYADAPPPTWYTGSRGWSGFSPISLEENLTSSMESVGRNMASTPRSSSSSGSGGGGFSGGGGGGGGGGSW